MTIEVAYVPMAGGLDLNSSAYSVKPGRIMGMQNFEKVYGRQGYRRIDGYERFDGHTKPSEAVLHKITFNSGAVEPTVGQHVETAGGLSPALNAYVISVTVTSGSWGASNAAGEVVLLLITEGTGWDGEAVYSYGDPYGTVMLVSTSDATTVIPSEPLYAEMRFVAIELLRSFISAVPGTGDVLGLFVYKQRLYAFRAVEGQDESSGAGPYLLPSTKRCNLYRSGVGSGWSLVTENIPFAAGVRFNFFVGSFTGSSSDQAVFIVNGKGRMMKYTDTGGLVICGDIQGSEATSTTTLSINSTTVVDKTFTIAGAARSWAVGETLHIDAVGTNQPILKGAVKSYSHPTLVLENIRTEEAYVSGVVVNDGSFQITSHSDWDLRKSDGSDCPINIMGHRDHMFLVYPYGQLQSSNTGDPMTYTSSAGLIGMGAEITGMVSLKGATLAVFCDSKISILSGTSVIDWRLDPHSTNAGARAGTLQENVGDALFLDDRGLTTLAASSAYGNFAPGVFSRDVASLLQAYIGRIKASVIAKAKYQYRLYMDDGLVLTGALNSTGSNITPNNTEFTVSKYPDAVTCFTVGDMDDGQDLMFFGTSDGYVMQEDVGVSFDGAAIDSAIRQHFNHFKTPSQKKRFRKLVLEVDSPNDVLINFKQSFDLDDGTYRPTGNQSGVQDLNTVGNDGGVWAESSWDTFRWSAPMASQATAHIDGFGKSMNLLMWHSSAIDEPFTIQGLLIHYSKMGLSL